MNHPNSPVHKARLKELDGFRALAILTVTAYHYFQRFPEIYPYGDQILPFVRWGYMGVEFFFMISGFVIVMTLETTENWKIFALKRAARLLPPIILASILTAVFLLILGDKLPESMQPNWADFIPSWTMTDPKLWHWIASEAKYIDGAYWSLYAELRFYIIAALAYYFIPRLKLQFVLAGLVIIGQLLIYLPFDVFAIQRERLAHQLFISDYLSFFAFGSFAFAIWRGHSGIYWIGAGLMLGVGLWGISEPVAQAAISVMALAFLSLIKMPILLRPLLLALPQFYGKISYSFYLLHQMIGVVLISKIPSDWGLQFQILGVLWIFAFVTLLAWGLFVLVENRSQRIIHALVP